jgi:hypothetical protein
MLKKKVLPYSRVNQGRSPLQIVGDPSRPSKGLHTKCSIETLNMTFYFFLNIKKMRVRENLQRSQDVLNNFSSKGHGRKEGTNKKNIPRDRLLIDPCGPGSFLENKRLK